MDTKILACLALAGCAVDTGVDGDLGLGQTDQALNGDTWSTYDDNPYAGGLGAENYGIASSPTSHKILVVGDRLETDGTPTWIIRGTPTGSGFGLNSTFKLAAGKTSEASAVIADSIGDFYVVGDAEDAGGVFHWIVRRSTDNAASWSTVLDLPIGGHPTALAVDTSFTVYVGGAIVDGTGVSQGVVYRGTNHGTTWTQVLSYTPGTQVSLDGLCVGTYQGQPSVFATGGTFDATLAHETAFVMHSADGLTWSTAFTFAPETTTNATGCASSPSGGMYFGFDGFDSGGSSRWDVLDVTNFSPLTDTDDGVTTSSGETNAAFAEVWANGEAYAVGRLDESAGQRWHVRKQAPTGVTWLDSDDYAGPGKTSFSEANSVAYDSVYGLYVAGKAYDDTGRLHGIVRHRQ